MKYPIDLILKVNEVFHDIEGSEYCHPEIIKLESNRWQNIGRILLSKESKKLKLLDIGSGTGFIPLQIAQYLKNQDLFICSDISTNLLSVCKKNLTKKNFQCQFEYLKLSGKKYDLNSKNLDFITLNSVLHHIPNFTLFFREIDRLLKIRGHIIIGHEPNKLFTEHLFMWYNYRFIYFLFNPKELFFTILKIFKLYKTGKTFYRKLKKKKIALNKKLQEINDCLMNGGIIKKSLTLDELTEIVDIHSPTAGGFHKEKGIDIPEIIDKYLPNFRLEYFESYRYLFRLSYKNKFTRLYNSLLKRLYPKKGATFFAVLKKIS